MFQKENKPECALELNVALKPNVPLTGLFLLPAKITKDIQKIKNSVLNFDQKHRGSNLIAEFYCENEITVKKESRLS